MNEYYKIEADSENQWGNEGEKGKIGVWDEEIQTTTHKINKQKGHIVQHREIQSLFCNNFKWNIKILNHYYIPKTNNRL